MKRLNYLMLLLGMMGLVLLTQSCEKEETDPCENVICENGGTCLDGICNCPDGFTGEFCETALPTIQERLDNGETPIAVFQSDNTLLDSIYGKSYEGGLIFYLNTTDGNGMVAAFEDIGDWSEWGCEFTDIPDLPNCEMTPTRPETKEGAQIGDGVSNTILIVNSMCADNSAAKACFDFDDGTYSDWFLPSRGELNELFINLPQARGNFTYRSSSEGNEQSAWSQYFDLDGTQFMGNKSLSGARVRAVRAF